MYARCIGLNVIMKYKIKGFLMKFNKYKYHLIVAIITCNRTDQLKICVNSVIDSVKYSKMTEMITILIVDNHVEASARLIISMLKKENHMLNIVYQVEPNQGIPYARNRCIKYARNNDPDYLIFIDDDEVADKEWINELLRSVVLHQADIVHGRVEKIIDDSKSSKCGIYLHHKLKLQKKNGEIIDRAATDNLLISRSIYSKYSFDENMKMTGGSDTMFTREAFLHGAKIVYAHYAVVREKISTDRLKISWIIKRHYRLGVNYSYIEMRLFNNQLTFYKILVKCILQIPRSFIELIYMIFKRECIIASMLPLVRGYGSLIGLFGGTYDEYASRHKNNRNIEL